MKVLILKVTDSDFPIHAECVDLCIIGRGKTREEALDNLVYTVVSSPEAEKPCCSVLEILDAEVVKRKGGGGVNFQIFGKNEKA